MREERIDQLLNTVFCNCCQKLMYVVHVGSKLLREGRMPCKRDIKVLISLLVLIPWGVKALCCLSLHASQGRISSSVAFELGTYVLRALRDKKVIETTLAAYIERSTHAY